MYESILFRHDGKQYEVRVTSDGNTIHVRAFLKGIPANGFAYSVDHTTIVDPDMPDYLAELSDPVFDLLQGTLSQAVDDVQTGRWEKYVAVAKQLKSSGQRPGRATTEHGASTTEIRQFRDGKRESKP